jgi:alkylation response protein AidB-like acyl-CoA dehydrogenase
VGRGDLAPGWALWRRLAGVGVTGLLVPEKQGGLGASPLDLVAACAELGHHAVPGPVAESLAAVPVLLAELDAVTGASAGSGPSPAGEWLGGLAAGELIATLAYGEVLATASALALEYGALAGGAQLLGAGRALLEASVRHVRVRTQVGRPVGAFQAVKHKLADVAIGLEFARPLLDAAALALGEGAATAPRDVSAAKVACADAAHRAARAALQVHGAICYTEEHDVSLWLLKIQALIPAGAPRPSIAPAS